MALSRTAVASLTFLGGVLVFGVVLGFVLAFQPARADPLEERWSELGVPEAEFVFLGDFTRGERESLKRDLKAAQVLFAERFGAVTSDFTVYVSADPDALNEQLLRISGSEYEDEFCGLARRDAIFLAIVEVCSGSVDYEHGLNLAHEYFHILQWDARGPRGNRLVEPGPPGTWLGWIIEGSAAYAEALFNDEQGRRSLAALREGVQVRWSALGQPFPRSFSQITDPLEEYTLEYRVGSLATDWLVERAGPEAVLKFFRFGGHGAAFETAFGVSVDEFYSGFESHRWEVAHPYFWRSGGTVVGSDGLPVEGMAVFAAVRIEGELWSAGMTETDAQGNFEFSVPGSGYVLGLFVQCPGDDENPEWAYAGAWGRDGLVADADRHYDADDRGAEPFAGEDQDRTELVIEIPETRESLIAKGCES
ncbi:MAG: hypothetical protein F4Z77_07500 [Dehalococcoidia bacterium]|nr:hypothetical protein [Dehalococcoidia bacterium]